MKKYLKNTKIKKKNQQNKELYKDYIKMILRKELIKNK